MVNEKTTEWFTSFQLFTLISEHGMRNVRRIEQEKTSHSNSLGTAVENDSLKLLPFFC